MSNDGKIDVVLIQPPQISLVDGVHFTKGIPPIGLAYIAGALEKERISYEVIDAIGEKINQLHRIENTRSLIRGLTYTEIVERIPAHTKIVGISIMFTSEWVHHKILIEMIKSKIPSCLIILGGEHASASWERILKKSSAVDFCVIGEGDETFIELVYAIKNDTDVSSVSGIAFSKNGHVQKTCARKRVKDISKFRVCWDKFPVEKYLSEKSGMNTLNLRAMPILASRGCPYQCTFCSSPQMWGTNYFTRPPEDIVKEMIELRDKYNVEHFDFTDLSMSVNRKWIKELCHLIIDAQLSSTWQFGPGTRSEAFNEEILELLKESNIYKLSFAPESGSQKTLKKIKKRVDINSLYKLIKISVGKKIHTKCQFIMGLPDQTFGEMVESALFILKLAFVGVDDVSIYAFYPYPGSELADAIEDKGMIIDDEEYSKMVNTKIDNLRIPDKQVINHSGISVFVFTTLLSVIYYALLYLLHPFKFYLLLKSLVNHRPRRSMEMFIYTKLHHRSFVNVIDLSNMDKYKSKA